MRKYLIVQFASFGDCLYATTIAKQIKNDFPDSHITWAISKKYSSILALNPYIDKIWEIDIPKGSNYYDKKIWEPFVSEVEHRKKMGEFDEIIFSQIPQKNWGRFDGTIRSTTLKGYAGNITVAVNPVLLLSKVETDRVAQFAEKYQLKDFKQVILFECAPGSGQSNVNTNFALNIAKIFSEQHQDYCFILSSPDNLTLTNKNIIDGSVLTFRENAELTKYCTFLIGCSSGITWLSTSEWAKQLPTLQLLNKASGIYAGLNFDFQINKLNNGHVIEMLDYDTEKVMSCLEMIDQNGIIAARQQFNQVYQPNAFHLKTVSGYMFDNGESSLSILRFAKQFIQHNQKLNNPITFNWLKFTVDLLLKSLKNIIR